MERAAGVTQTRDRVCRTRYADVPISGARESPGQGRVGDCRRRDCTPYPLGAAARVNVVLGEWWSVVMQDPAGWIQAGVALVVAIVGAVFHRRVWVAIKWLAAQGAKALRWLGSLRLTTASRMIPRDEPLILPARWAITRERGAEQYDFMLANTVDGAVAQRVELECLSDELHLFSAGVWSEIPGGRMAPFKLRGDQSAFYTGVYFRVTWTDANGRRRTHAWLERRG